MHPSTSAAPPREKTQRWTFCGTFLICFALLSFEVTTVRTINFTVGPSYIYVAIALAMLGLSAAGSVLSLVNLKSLSMSRGRVLFWACLAIAAFLVASHFIAADAKAHVNAAVAASGRALGLQGVVQTLVSKSFEAALLIGMALSLPYFLFGAMLAYLFATTEGSLYGRLYASDLIGAALGCIGAILLMEFADYAMSVTGPAVVAALAAAAFVVPSSKRLAAGGMVAALVLCIAPNAGWYERAIEPPADPNYLARDYGYKSDVTEIWRGWNSFTRVGAVNWTDQDGPHTGLSLGNAEGVAWLVPYDPGREEPSRHRAALLAMLPTPAPETLVLFAGAGADIMSLHEHGAGRTRVIGVELNPTVVEGGLELGEYRLADFLAKPGVTLEVAEGRSFLERDERRYDRILLSWSGATAAYYAGALGGTTQYLNTYEGLSAVLDHLKPDGNAVVMSVNKVNVLAALRRYLKQRGIENAPDTAIVLYDRRLNRYAWDAPWDYNPLLIKPAGWSRDEVARVKAKAAEDGWQIAYAPGEPVNEEFQVYSRILKAADPDAELAALRKKTKLRFDVVTDDRPFYLDLFANELYLSAEFWSDVVDGKIAHAHQFYHVIRVILVGVICVLALMLILTPLFLRKGPPRTKRTFSHLTYFFCLGTGFMFLEIGLMQKAGLLFGNPGLTIAIVLASVILFSGLGSLLSNLSFQNGISFPALAAATCFYALILFFGIDSMQTAMLAMPMLAKAAILCAIIAPGAFLMGHLFPQGLAVAGKENAALVPWAWGINGAMSTISAGIAPLIAQAWGLNVLFVIGAGVYALILVLPPYGRRAGATHAATLSAPIQQSGTDV